MSSWVRCPCGNRIGTGAFPNPDVYRAIAETAYDAVDDPIDRKKLSSLFLQGLELVRCSNCGRILIREPGTPGYVSYLREDSEQ